LSHDSVSPCFSLFSSTPPTTSLIYTLSLHDALPIYSIKLTSDVSAHAILLPKLISKSAENILERKRFDELSSETQFPVARDRTRSEEHTSELQSRFDLVCRLLLEKKKDK